MARIKWSQRIVPSRIRATISPHRTKRMALVTSPYQRLYKLSIKRNKSNWLVLLSRISWKIRFAWKSFRYPFHSSSQWIPSKSTCNSRNGIHAIRPKTVMWHRDWCDGCSRISIVWKRIRPPNDSCLCWTMKCSPGSENSFRTNTNWCWHNRTNPLCHLLHRRMWDLVEWKKKYWILEIYKNKTNWSLPHMDD